MHLVIPQYSVEDLTIEGVSLIPNVILYLIHKFPRLKNLTMNEYGDSFGGRSAFFYLSVYGDKSTMGKFFKYMSRMNTFKIRGKLMEEQLADMMELYGSIIANNNDLTVVFSYDNVHHEGQYLRIDFERTSSKETQQKRIEITKPKHLPTCTVLKLRQAFGKCTQTPPHLTFVRQYGANIKEFSVIAPMGAVTVVNILLYCTSLEALTLMNMNFSHDCKDIYWPSDLKNETIEILVFDSCDWHKKNFTSLKLANIFLHLNISNLSIVCGC